MYTTSSHKMKKKNCDERKKKGIGKIRLISPALKNSCQEGYVCTGGDDLNPKKTIRMKAYCLVPKENY